MRQDSCLDFGSGNRDGEKGGFKSTERSVDRKFPSSREVSSSAPSSEAEVTQLQPGAKSYPLQDMFCK